MIIDGMEQIEIEYIEDSNAITICQKNSGGESDVVWIPGHCVEHFMECLTMVWEKRHE